VFADAQRREKVARCSRLPSPRAESLCHLVAKTEYIPSHVYAAREWCNRAGSKPPSSLRQFMVFSCPVQAGAVRSLPTARCCAQQRCHFPFASTRECLPGVNTRCRPSRPSSTFRFHVARASAKSARCRPFSQRGDILPPAGEIIRVRVCVMAVTRVLRRRVGSAPF